MYDVLFIDDKFEEVGETFFTFQQEHIRCFYSDGDRYLPSNDREKLPFKNLKYICLDLHLENRGITSLSDKNAVSTLAGVVKSFTENEDVCVIINTSFSKEFNEHKDSFIKYLEFKPKIKIEQKARKTNNKFSSIHRKKIKDDIIRKSHQSLLRNIVIREAIEIEKLIWNKILSSNILKGCKKTEDILKKLKIKIGFSKKIDIYNNYVDNNTKKQLNELREIRNEFAHSTEPPETNLLDFLEEIKNLKQRINHK